MRPCHPSLPDLEFAESEVLACVRVCVFDFFFVCFYLVPDSPAALPGQSMEKVIFLFEKARWLFV